MKRQLLRACCVLGCVLAAAPTQAQTATPANNFAFDQGGLDLATVSAFTYRLYVDGAVTGSPIAAICTGTASPFVCSTPVGAFTPGIHTVTLTAANAAGESVHSAPLTFTMVIVPSAPSNLRIQ
jgi:hypothetical protein